MAARTKHLTHRGDLRAVATYGDALAFTTIHPDGIPTALYMLSLEKLELSEVKLGCGGLSLAVSGGDLWLGGDDATLYHLAPKAKQLKACKVELPAKPASLACLAGDRLAVLCADRLVVVDAKKGTELQSFELPERGASLAADPTGEWLAVGGAKGQVSVYECEGKDAFQLSESDKLHEGRVTSLLFEPEELRFFSAGADQKLLLTHARGKLEPEDRGRGAAHADQVTAMVHAPGERFITVSRDKSCKSWARVGATRPATFDEATPAVVDAVLVEIHSRPHLVIAGQDNSLRFILLDAGGRFSSMTDRLYDAYDRAAELLRDSDVARRGEGVHALAEYDDSRSIELLAKQIGADQDHGLRLRATELLAKSDHPLATKSLEPLLKHSDEAVRMAAFKGLRDAAGKTELRPLRLAIDSKQANVGVAAVEALTPLAKKDEQSRQLLIQTLDVSTEELRKATLLGLEKIFAKGSSEPTLIAMKSSQADIRGLALIRCYQREILGDSQIQGAVRRSGEDRSADVRRTAFLVALLSRAKLAKALRERDEDLHRQIFELENLSLEPKKGKAKSPPKVKPAAFSLAVEDYDPLLSAMSSRMVDTCLLGSRCLALLGDARAFGTLLQLSREEDASVRVQVCQALAALDDIRAAQRLETMVNDSAAEVRDAAYTALEHIYKSELLDGAEIGMSSTFVEVRRRALKTLSSTMQKSRAKKVQARAMLQRALNDDDNSVSGEAFKTAMGIPVDGSPEAALRFTLGSVRTNVRREVLTEAMAQDKHAWAQELLLDFLNDPSPKVRADAYEHLLEKSKGRDIAPMQAALKSRFADIRLLATSSLIELKTEEAQQALLAAIEDDDEAVRERAVEALINTNDSEVLRNAMASRHTDVRLQAACALALFHDEQAKAPLIESATAEEPERDADKDRWEKEVVAALGGLELLGLQESVPTLLPLLDSTYPSVRGGAAKAIAGCVGPDQVELLSEPLQHDDTQVRFRIAMGLAFCRELTALPLVFSKKAGTVLGAEDQLMAAAAYGEAAETQLIAMLDSQHPWIRNAAFLVLLFRDWRARPSSPGRILAALSAIDPRVRLHAARALEAYSDAEAFEQFLVEFVNDRGDEQAWTIASDLVHAMADAVVNTGTRCQTQLIATLKLLNEPKQSVWDFGWKVFRTRYAETLKAAAADQPAQEVGDEASSELQQLAFGVYVGLVREQGGYHDRGARPAFGATVTSIRQAAMRRLIAMAEADPNAAPATRSVLIQALGDDLQDVRMFAFEQLANVGVDVQTRAAAAIECGHTDLAVEALKLLTADSGKKGREILENVVRTRDDRLASEAGVLLLRMTDATTAADAALESPNPRARMLAVGWLAAAYEDDAKAKKALVAAYGSRYSEVRREVAFALATKQDAKAFEMLLEQLQAPGTKNVQARIVNTIVALGDERSGDALLDLLENDKEQAYEPEQIFNAVASFRRPESAERLLALLDRKEWRDQISGCIRQITGYDQYCADTFDDLPNRNWMESQHPRHDGVLARYLQQCLDLNLPNLIKPFIADARWSLTNEVDDVLKSLSVHPDAVLRISVVDAIGWRFRKRSGPPDALLDLLEHRDANTKFLAAVGLARGGRADGLTIVLSAVELMTDLSQRILAVQALGELADERSLEVLLKLANEDGHALQDTALEAIGHLGQSDQAEEIFKLLERLAGGHGSAARRAIVGLRWFNTPSGWDVIREIAREGGPFTETALTQLGYNDEPATRALLLKTLESGFAGWALPPAKRLFGDESLEPDYAMLQTLHGYRPDSHWEHDYRCLERVCGEGDAEKIFEILPHCDSHETLATALLQRDPLPSDAAARALDSPHARAAEVAASIVGRAAKKELGQPLGAAIGRWTDKWNDSHQEAISRGRRSYEIEELTRALCRLAWAAGRTQSAKAELLTMLQSHVDLNEFGPVRRAAILALAECKLSKSELTALESLVSDADAVIRQTAAEVLAQQDASRAAKRMDELLTDRSTLRRIMAYDKVDASAAVEKGAGNAHYQANVLPTLIAASDVERLSQVAGDGETNDAARLGAIEGLARMANRTADEQLAEIGKNESISEELRKAAWRGLRRSKRVQAGLVSNG